MENSTNKNTIVLYHNVNGEIQREEQCVTDMKHASAIANNLLKPHIGDSTINVWSYSQGTNFVTRDYGVLIKGFKGE